MSSAPIRIIQISDTHLYADTQKKLLGVNPAESFKAVMDLLAADTTPIDMILHTGDLSQDGSEASYIHLAEALKKLKVPVYCIPGNHDNAKRMASIYPRDTISNNKHIILKNWHLILLDSQKPGEVGGALKPSELAYLQQCLKSHPKHEAVIVFHHQPVPVGSRWLDHLGLENANEFWQVISDYPKINTILFGHVHQEYEQIVRGIKCYSPPATCFQFKPQQDHFGIEELPPGFRWVNLYDDGHIETGIKRVAKYIGKFEGDATGY